MERRLDDRNRISEGPLFDFWHQSRLSRPNQFHIFQCLDDFSTRDVPVPLFFRNHLVTDCGQLRIQLRIESQWRRRFLNNFFSDHLDRAAGKRPFARQHLKQHHADSIDVAAVIDPLRFAGRLFR